MMNTHLQNDLPIFLILVDINFIFVLFKDRQVVILVDEVHGDEG